jgi:hypothetical protein
VTVEARVAAEAGMAGVVVVDRRRAIEVDFLQRPVKRTVGVAQRQGAEVARDEDGDATIVVAADALEVVASLVASMAAPKVRPLSDVPDIVKVMSMS